MFKKRKILNQTVYNPSEGRPSMMYAIKDNVSNELSAPFYCRTDDLALRIFSQEVGKALAQLNENSKKLGYEVKTSADDYTLLCLGTIDLDTGAIIPAVRDLSRF